MVVKLNPGIGSIPAGKWVSHGLVAILALAFGFVVVMILVWGMPDRDSLPKRASLNATTDPEGVVGGITETGDQLLAGNEDGTAAAGGATGSSGEDPGAEVEAERRLAEIRRRQDEAQRRLEELEFQAQHAPLGQSLYGLAPAAKGRTEMAVSPPAEDLVLSEGGPSMVAQPGSPGQDPDDDDFQDELLLAGTVIPVSTITAIDSGLPGIVRAQVTAPVRDSATGTRVLVPPGAMLVGTWADNPDVHAERLHVYWRKLQMPDGESFELDDTPSADLAGVSGISGARKTRFWRTFGAAFAISLVTNLASREQVDDNPIEDALKRAAGNTAQTVTERLLERDLNATPVFRIAAGTHLNVVLEQDLRLPPWTSR